METASQPTRGSLKSKGLTLLRGAKPMLCQSDSVLLVLKRCVRFALDPRDMSCKMFPYDRHGVRKGTPVYSYDVEIAVSTLSGFNRRESSGIH